MITGFRPQAAPDPLARVRLWRMLGGSGAAPAGARAGVPGAPCGCWRVPVWAAHASARLGAAAAAPREGPLSGLRRAAGFGRGAVSKDPPPVGQPTLLPAGTLGAEARLPQCRCGAVWQRGHPGPSTPGRVRAEPAGSAVCGAPPDTAQPCRARGAQTRESGWWRPRHRSAEERCARVRCPAERSGQRGLPVSWSSAHRGAAHSRPGVQAPR